MSNKNKDYIWAEKYRPKTLTEFIGNDVVKNKIQGFIDQKDIPHLLFYGSAGTGKTSLAKIIVKSIPCDHIYINASNERTIDIVRDKIMEFSSTISFNSLRIIILDEADYITSLSLAALRNIMETNSKNCRFILTCNHIERIIDPIISRCGGGMKIEPLTKESVALHIVDILTKEDIKYTVNDVGFIINSYYPDIRKIINFTQQNVDSNKNLSIASSNVIESDYKEKLISLLKTPKKSGVFKEIRQLIADASFSNYDEIYSYLFDKVDTYSNGKDGEVILEIADAVYQSSLVFEKEITFVAMMQKLLKVLN